MVTLRCYLLSKTAALCAAFFVLGISIAIPGPTLLDLMTGLNTDIATMSTIYIWRSTGYLIGCIGAGFLFDRFNRIFLLFASLLLAAISMSVIPWFKTIWIFSVSMIVVGTTTGFVDIGGNVLLLDMWRKESGPFLQALHFSFGIGALTAPLLAQPFLEQQQEVIMFDSPIQTNISQGHLADTILNINSFNDSFIANTIAENLNRDERSVSSEHDNALQYSTLNIVLPTSLDKLEPKTDVSENSELQNTSGIGLPDTHTTHMQHVSDQTVEILESVPSLSLMNKTIQSSSLQNSTFTAEPTHRNSLKQGTDVSDAEDVSDLLLSEEEESGLSNMQILYMIVGLLVLIVAFVFLGFLCYKSGTTDSKREDDLNQEPKIEGKVFYILVVLLSWFFFLYVGMEVTFGQMILASSVKGDLHLSKSAGSYLTATFWATFSVMRFLTIFFSNKFSPLTILIFDFVLCTAGTIALAAFGDSVEFMLWLGTALLGAGFATVFPSGILWMENYIAITNKVASAFVVGAAMGEMFCPWSVGHFMDESPMILIYAVTVANFLCIITFAVMWLIATKTAKKLVKSKSPEQEMLNKKNEEKIIPMQTMPSKDVERHSLTEGGSLVNGN